MGHSPRGRKELDMTDHTHTHTGSGYTSGLLKNAKSDTSACEHSL